jgi:hypothetical protein
MKNFQTSLNLLVVLAVFAPAQSQAEGDVKLSFNSAIKSSYVGGQVPVRIYEGSVAQNSVTASRKGTYAFLWVSSPLDGGWNQNYGSEIDLGFGHDFALSQSWRLDVGYTYYNLTPLENTKGDLHALSAQIYATAGSVRPFLRLEQDVPQNPSVLPGGFSYKLGANWSDPSGIQIQGALFGHGRLFGSPAEALSAGRLDVSKGFESDGISWRLGVALQQSLRLGGLARNETVLYLSFSF